MANNINVSLDTASGVNRLSVTDNGGQNQVGQSTNPTTISWNLTGVLTQGDFVPMIYWVLRRPIAAVRTYIGI